MQVKKDEVRIRILDAAKQEFLDKGFEKASIRQIASRAGVTKGNIYTYFSTKDDIFKTLAEPALDEVLAALSDEYGDVYVSRDFQEVYTLEHSIEGFKHHVATLQKYREPMKLLFFCSTGSSLEHFKERIISAYEKSSLRFYDIVGQYNSNLNTQVTQLFVHTCAVLYTGFIEEILIHEPNEKDLHQFIKEITMFVHYCTLSVMTKSN